MKLIALNLWNGIMHEQLEKFITNQQNKTDIFCFQEVRNGEYAIKDQGADERTELFNEIKNWLPGFTGYFTEMKQGVGIASFIKNNIAVEKIESNQILTEEETKHLKMANGNSFYPRMIQSIYLKNGSLVIHNFHGLPGNFKKDTPERSLQTKRLLTILNDNPGSQILVGDFNLDINTEAISQLSNKMRNLVQEGKFKTTRNSNYQKFNLLPFADYAFVSGDIKINNFTVLPDEVSDHLPLCLKFKSERNL
jgi:endonuclease/exonuclease/phosphatase family metal-dependent hydrolase